MDVAADHERRTLALDRLEDRAAAQMPAVGLVDVALRR
jgi:hypothetical protein